MSVSTAAGNEASDAEPPVQNDVVRHAVDFNGHPAFRSKSGNWTAASFIIGNQGSFFSFKFVFLSPISQIS